MLSVEPRDGTSIPMTKRDHAAATISEWIKNGTYAPGAKLPSILKLAEMFGMTDQPVRKALAQLSDERLVVARNGVGVFVRDPARKAHKVLVLSPVGGTPTPHEEDTGFAGWEVYRGVAEALAGWNGDSCLALVSDYERDPRALLGRYRAESCDALLSLDARGDEIADASTWEIGYTRVVSAAYSDPVCRFHGVRVDVAAAIGAVLERAYALGHRRFALLYGANIAQVFSHLQRYRCFVEFCQARSLAPPPAAMLAIGGEAMDGYRATLRLLTDAPDITAIFAVTDNRAKGVLQALRDRGITPGKEISVIGFDGMPGIEDWDLTTVAVPRRQVGREAVALLDRTLDAPLPVFRGSLGPAPGA